LKGSGQASPNFGLFTPLAAGSATLVSDRR
jgi:hypothetical protein